MSEKSYRPFENRDEAKMLVGGIIREKSTGNEFLVTGVTNDSIYLIGLAVGFKKIFTDFERAAHADLPLGVEIKERWAIPTQEMLAANGRPLTCEARTGQQAWCEIELSAIAPYNTSHPFFSVQGARFAACRTKVKAE